MGCIVAGAAGYIDGSSIKSAPAITFLWVKTFKISVYPQAILPMLAVYSKWMIKFDVSHILIVAVSSFTGHGSYW